MIKLIDILNEILTEKKLCKKGKAYYDRRIAAGEKPSAYLSGRAVKVCKGLMEEDDKIKGEIYCVNCPWHWSLAKGGNDPYICHKCSHDNYSAYNPMEESLRDWFKKEDWVRIDTQGNITGPCGTMKKGKATTRCLPRKKAQSLTKAERAATSRKKVAGSKKGKQFVKNTKAATVSLNK